MNSENTTRINVNRVAKTLTVVYSIGLFFAVFDLFSLPEYTSIIVVSAFVMFLVLMGSCVWLSQQGQEDSAAWVLVLGGSLLSCCIMILVGSENNLLHVMAFSATWLLINIQLLPRRYYLLSTIFVLGLTIAIVVPYFVEVPQILNMTRDSLSPIHLWELKLVPYYIAAVLMGLYTAHRFNAYDLRTKLVITALAVSIVSVGGVASAVHTLAQRNVLEQTGTSLNRKAQADALAITQDLHQGVQLLRVLTLQAGIKAKVVAANDVYVVDEALIQQALDAQSLQWSTSARDSAFQQARLNNDLVTDLKLFQQQHPAYEQLFITDRYGGLIGATHYVETYAHGEQVWWQEVMADGFGQSYIDPDPIVRDEDGAVLVQLAVPIYANLAGDEGDVLGVLYASYRSDVISGVFQEDVALKTDLYTSVAEQKVLSALVESPYQDVEGQLLSRATLWDLQTGHAPYVRTYYNDEISFVAYAPLQSDELVVANLNWAVTTHQREAVVLQPIERQRKIATAVGLALILGTGIVALFFGRFLTQPLQELTLAAEQIASGRLLTTVSVTTEDEMSMLAASFNSMAAQLQQTLDDLDRGIIERTQALLVSAKVSRRLSMILDQETLATQLVALIQESFHYYYVQFYLYSERRQSLWLAAGVGKIGNVLPKNTYEVAPDQGVVGNAFTNNETILVSDVSKYADWVAEPLLPDTRAELAIPIIVSGVPVGVLDVRDDRIGGISQSDVNLIESIASQVAVAMQNAHLYQLAQQKANREALISSISQQIQNATTVAGALETAAQELGRNLNARRIEISIHAQKNQQGVV